MGKISDEREKAWAIIFVQGIVACEPATFEQIVAKLTRLKLQKPTQGMTGQETGLFLEDIAEELERMEYSIRAITEGIRRLTIREDSPFFPSLKILLKYIHPIHFEIFNRVKMLGKMLEAKHE